MRFIHGLAPLVVAEYLPRRKEHKRATHLIPVSKQ